TRLSKRAAVVRELVCSCLHRDPVAADLRCSLFIAAAQNYKKDSLLRPFPPRYIHKDSKDFDALVRCTRLVLASSRIPKTKHHMALAHWILSSKSFAYAKLCTLTQSDGVSAPAPDFLFELEYCDQLNARFERMREDRDVFYAFHGSRLENFHSIIHNGLHCHLNKNSVFGEGTYLTSDLSLAVLYSPHSSGWQESLLGPMLSCIALCEVIDHPDVKCQVKRKDSEIVDRQRSRAKNSEGGDVPEKYFVVTNNQLLRVKYLLVYSQRRHTARRSRNTSWFLRHHFAVMMSLYLLLLIFIGTFNSNTFTSFWNRRNFR
uniref:Poly [ADP-ribose] polymerase n=1 Tax=Hippocampus comes TaxID=109280 RepID=A0A3Q3E5L5_HIPCM